MQIDGCPVFTGTLKVPIPNIFTVNPAVMQDFLYFYIKKSSGMIFSGRRILMKTRVLVILMLCIFIFFCFFFTSCQKANGIYQNDNPDTIVASEPNNTDTIVASEPNNTDTIVASEPDDSESPVFYGPPEIIFPDEEIPSSVESETENLVIWSPKFEHWEKIPDKYTAEGEDISPPLKWKNTPEKTKSFAIIFEDPDAPGGIWVHWILFNINPDLTELPAGITGETKPEGSLFGKNSWDKLTYNGPSPPPGKAHRYVFKIYALDTMLSLEEGADKKALEEAMEGHILAMAPTMGLYSREK